jgi:chromosome partitioning protein
LEIWSLINQKGGVGKTTLSINLAHCLRVSGYKVCLVDADDQGSVRQWQSIADWDEFPIVALDTKQSLKMIRTVLTGYDYVIVDTPGRIAGVIGSAIGVSDKVIIPIQPSPYDLWGTHDAVRLIEQHIEAYGRPLAAFLISAERKRTVVAKELRKALCDYTLPVLRNKTTRRVAYLDTATCGDTVFSYVGTREAAIEITDLAKEIIGLASF